MTDRSDSEWFENEKLWEECYDFMFSEARFQAAEEEVEHVLGLAGLETGGAETTVLDLGCGPGRHALSLAAKGFAVTAVDLSAHLLERARERAAAAGLEVDWQRQDMRRFHARAAYDLALSLFTTFGYFDDRRDDLRVLENVHEALRPGGALVLDVRGKEELLQRFTPADARDLVGGAILFERRELFADLSRVRTRWFLIHEGRVIEHGFELNLYAGRELADLLERAGFADVKLFGSLDGAPYDLEAKRLVALARKAH